MLEKINGFDEAVAPEKLQWGLAEVAIEESLDGTGSDPAEKGEFVDVMMRFRDELRPIFDAVQASHSAQ